MSTSWKKKIQYHSQPHMNEHTFNKTEYLEKFYFISFYITCIFRKKKEKKWRIWREKLQLVEKKIK